MASAPIGIRRARGSSFPEQYSEQTFCRGKPLLDPRGNPAHECRLGKEQQRSDTEKEPTGQDGRPSSAAPRHLLPREKAVTGLGPRPSRRAAFPSPPSL